MVLVMDGTGAIKLKKLSKRKRNSHLRKGITLRFSEVPELEGIENSGASHLTRARKKNKIQN